MSKTPRLLEVRHLAVAFPGSGDGAAGPSVQVVRDVSFDVGPGEIVGIVGESGSGKSITALSILGLVPPPGRITAGSIRLRGDELVGLHGEALRQVRGREIAMVFQDPMTSLNPALTVGYQVEEAMTAHGGARGPARSRVTPLLRQVQIADPERRKRAYPFQFSGGMRQRAMIAAAVANRPAVLLADEPTTALDVTVQAQVLELLRELSADMGMAVVLITHNVALVANLCQRILVMYGGQIVESGPAATVLSDPQHPYTWALLRASPTIGTGRGERLATIEGQAPDPAAIPSGCAFHPRCPFRIERCVTDIPPADPVAAGRTARCWVLMRNVPAGARS